MKSMGNLAKLLIKVGIILSILGILCMIVANANKGTEIKYGYGGMVDGEFHGRWETGIVGGNDENVETFEMRAGIFFIAASFCFLGGTICFVKKSRMQGMEKIVQVGRVLEKNQNIVMIEFEDGTRKYFSVEPEVTITNGDFGKMTLQGNFLVAFEKR